METHVYSIDLEADADRKRSDSKARSEKGKVRVKRKVRKAGAPEGEETWVTETIKVRTLVCS